MPAARDIATLCGQLTTLGIDRVTVRSPRYCNYRTEIALKDEQTAPLPQTVPPPDAALHD